jgi:hypothetical protein
VQGALADIARHRLEELNSKQVEETATWLATVELPKATTPPGPGTPGSRPGFEATTPATDPVGGTATSISELFGELGVEDSSRYEAPAATPGDAATPAGEAPAESGADASPAEESATAIERPAEENAPATEQPAAEGAAADEAPTETEPAEEAEQPAASAPAEQ